MSWTNAPPKAGVEGAIRNSWGAAKSRLLKFLAGLMFAQWSYEVPINMHPKQNIYWKPHVFLKQMVLLYFSSLWRCLELGQQKQSLSWLPSRNLLKILRKATPEWFAWLTTCHAPMPGSKDQRPFVPGLWIILDHTCSFCWLLISYWMGSETGHLETLSFGL